MKMTWGVRDSLHAYCHQKKIYAKFNLKVFYPSSYEGTVGIIPGYSIKRTESLFDWESALTDLAVNEQVSF